MTFVTFWSFPDIKSQFSCFIGTVVLSNKTIIVVKIVQCNFMGNVENAIFDEKLQVKIVNSCNFHGPNVILWNLLCWLGSTSCLVYFRVTKYGSNASWYSFAFMQFLITTEKFDQKEFLEIFDEIGPFKRAPKPSTSHISLPCGEN